MLLFVVLNRRPFPSKISLLYTMVAVILHLYSTLENLFAAVLLLLSCLLQFHSSYFRTFINAIFISKIGSENTSSKP